MYKGEERRDLSKCPMTAEQAYDMKNLLNLAVAQNGEMIKKQDKIIEQQEIMDKRIGNLERYFFAGRIVIASFAIVAGIAAYFLNIAHEIRDFSK